MAQDSKIEWTDHTANLWHGCTKVHEGCDHCYAETLSKRWGNDVWGNDKPRKQIGSVWNDLVKYQALAKAANATHRVFVGSMMDIFEKPMRLIDSKGNEVAGSDTGFLRDLFFQQISAGLYPNLQFLLLTKRPSNINKYIPKKWLDNPPANVMFGTSPVNQETANKLIGQLLQVNGKRFLSVEPQLDHIDLSNFILMPSLTGSPTDLEPSHGIDWVIQGGESGHGKRPFNLDWAYSMQKQCAVAGVPYFFKQIDKIQPVPENLMNRQFPS
jgi:protein gp37